MSLDVALASPLYSCRCSGGLQHLLPPRFGELSQSQPHRAPSQAPTPTCSSDNSSYHSHFPALTREVCVKGPIPVLEI